ncbi:GP88 family protein [Maritalea mediterranea]|uniref:Gene product 88 domain-containing protein n=1 Tax=Maritalea mediterranea TaxID=2909667 RepID=A0ABS9E6U3_9HYPH|nr:hypothetical protein [Maritalea mediterranea]MCF4098600.1 hypothetical protein [Maritalea mediterranea]
MFAGTLIRSGNNAKTVKGDGAFETAIMYLAPATLAGGPTVCPMAEKAGCLKACLNTAGRGRMSNVQKARVAKTQRYHKDRAAFMSELVDNLERFERYCAKKGVKPVVRLNGTSDIQWEVGHPCVRTHKTQHDDPMHYVVNYAHIFEAFPNIQFYDYTKIYKRVYRDLPDNYTLVLSYSEADSKYAMAVEKAHSDTGCNVAVVFRDKKTIEKFEGTALFGEPTKEVPIVNGDETDLRHLDPKGVIVALYAKGDARKDKSGFVIG